MSENESAKSGTEETAAPDTPAFEPITSAEQLQAHVDRVLRGRIDRLESKHAEQLTKLTELATAETARADAAEASLAGIEKEAAVSEARAAVAEKFGVDADLLAAFEDEAAMSSFAEKLAEKLGPQRPAPVRSEGLADVDAPASDTPRTGRDWAAQFD